ncbi:MAG TPA: hypothetical protein VLN44_00800 [Pyrinomonadaceae bacterium]|nr:hypothetical protein [Pyrinomonadaceae bacterium]
MQLLNQLETEPIPLEEEERRHTRRLLVGVLCAVVLTGSVFGGYLFLRKRHERQVAAASAEENIKKATPKVEVLVDDAMVEGKKSVLGGTIHNISGETLRNVAVELRLRKRSGGGLETRVVTPEATELAPDGRTRYSLEVAVQDYSSATFSKVLAGDTRTAIAFKAFPGAARPPMEAPASKTLVVGRPAPAKGEEFLNTEKNPGKVP